MKKVLLATISVAACFTARAQNVSDADIERYLAAHPEVVTQYTENRQKTAKEKSFWDELQPAPISVIDEIVHNPDFYSIGNPKGNFVIIEFFDYQCGWCKKSHQALSKMLESEKAKNIRIIPVATPIFGESSELIAKYVLAAGKQGKFKEMHDAVLTAGTRLDEEGLLNIAKGLGLDTARLTKEATSEEIERLLETANTYKSKMHISGVPMFIVNGKVHNGALLDEKVQEILEAQGSMPIYKGTDEIKVAEPHVAEPSVKTQQKPTEYASKIAPDIMETIKQARAEGIIKPDGRFNVNDENGKFSGQLLCSDNELEKKLNAWDTEINSDQPDEEKMRQYLDGALRCISVSNFEFKGKEASIKFMGGYTFPTFADNSKGTIITNDKVIDLSFKLSEKQQTADIIVRSNSGAKLAYISFQYDAERMAIPLEWGMSGQLMDYITRSGGSRRSNDRMIRQLQIWTQENELLTDDVFKINKAEIYQPDGKKVLILNGQDKNKYVLRVFNSIEREFFNVLWTEERLKMNLNFPQSGGRILESEAKFSPNFKENYKRFSEEYQKEMLNAGYSVRAEASAMQMAQLLAGLKEEATLYGLDGEPLARLKVKLNDSVVSTEQPADVIDYALLSILKPRMNCSVRSVSFTKANPNEMTVCDSSGCKNQSPQLAFSQIAPCFEDMETIFDKLGTEMKGELGKLEHIYIPGVSDGYNAAMNRYRANEILDAAAKVAIVSVSANGGMGQKEDLSALGGYKSMNLEGIVASDSAIRGTPEGVVTIELNPKTAKDIMPIIKDLSGNRVVSGCTPSTNICVLDMAKSVK